jgi:hypothetical protein
MVLENSDVKPAEGAVSPSPTPGQGAATPPVVKPAEPTPAATGASPAPQGVKEEEKVVPIQALHEERSRRQALEAERQQLQALVQQYQQPMQMQMQQPMENPVQKELEQLWDTDPRKAVQAEIMLAMDWRDKMDAGIDYQAEQLSKKYPDFANYRTSVQAYVRNLPLDQRTRPGIIESAYFLAKGQNADTLVQQQKDELFRQFQSGQLSAQGVSMPAAGAMSQPQVPQGNSITLTAEQIAVAGAMGLTPEQYASAMPRTAQ